jgi:hypothetical protein
MPLYGRAITFGAVSAPSDVVMELLAAETDPVPLLLVAATVKLYAVAPLRPETMIGLAVPVAVKLPGLEVTV